MMDAKKTDYKAAFDAWAKTQSGRIKPLNEKEIDAFRRGELDEETRLDFLQRAAFNQEDLNILLEDGQPDPALNPAHVESSWQVFRQRLSFEPGLKKNKVAPAVENFSRRAPPTWFLAAASLFFGAVMLGLWLMPLFRNQPPASMADAVVREIYFDGVTRGEKTTPRKARVQTLRLHLPRNWPPYERYLVTLTHGDGREIYSRETNDNGEQVLTLAIWTRASGSLTTYRLSIHGLEGGVRGREVLRDLSLPMIE